MTDTRTAILDAAARLYAADGYSAVSMRDVAAEVSMTQANLYYHFRDKAQLVEDTLAHVLVTRMSPLDDLFKTTSSPEYQLRVFVEWFVTLLFNDLIFTQLMLRELIDGDMERVARLSRVVFDKPFSLIDGIVSAYSPGLRSALTTASVIALIIGHVQMARILPYLSSGHADHADPKIIAAHVLSTLRRALKDQSDAL